MTVDLEARRTELLDLRQRLTVAAEGILADDEENGELNSAAGWLVSVRDGKLAYLHAYSDPEEAVLASEQ